jgi:hypothetical protein
MAQGSLDLALFLKNGRITWAIWPYAFARLGGMLLMPKDLRIKVHLTISRHTGEVALARQAGLLAKTAHQSNSLRRARLAVAVDDR